MAVLSRMWVNYYFTLELAKHSEFYRQNLCELLCSKHTLITIIYFSSIYGNDQNLPVYQEIFKIFVFSKREEYSCSLGITFLWYISAILCNWIEKYHRQQPNSNLLLSITPCVVNTSSFLIQSWITFVLHSHTLYTC